MDSYLSFVLCIPAFSPPRPNITIALLIKFSSRSGTFLSLFQQHQHMIGQEPWGSCHYFCAISCHFVDFFLSFFLSFFLFFFFPFSYKIRNGKNYCRESFIKKNCARRERDLKKSTKWQEIAQKSWQLPRDSCSITSWGCWKRERKVPPVRKNIYCIWWPQRESFKNKNKKIINWPPSSLMGILVPANWRRWRRWRKWRRGKRNPQRKKEEEEEREEESKSKKEEREEQGKPTRAATKKDRKPTKQNTNTRHMHQRWRVVHVL